jgi:hypothetical protein
MHKLGVPEMSRLTLEMSNVDQHSILTDYTCDRGYILVQHHVSPHLYAFVRCS